MVLGNDFLVACLFRVPTPASGYPAFRVHGFRVYP
jgi:hypothetical protein